VKSGRLRPLANLGPKRSDQLPQVPTMKEAGVAGVEVVVWYGLFAPAATPRDIVAKLGDAIGRAARSPDMKQRLVDLGAEPVGNTPEEFGKLLRDELTRWAEVVKVSGARVD
jgi:tripartite-type tricarboxylate transporter receptor subunit TctC